MRRSKRARRPNDKVETDTFVLKGGLNLVDAPIATPEGMALAATNLELLSRDGYRRVDGFERFDGQPKPSAATYWILKYSKVSVLGGPAVNGIVIGASGGAEAKVILDVPTVSNLLTYTEQYQNAVWTGFHSGTITINDIAAPDGTTTADKFDNSNGHADSYTQEWGAGVIGQYYSLSIHVKEGTQSQIRLGMLSNGVLGYHTLHRFDWVAGAPVFDPASYTANTYASTGIVTPLADGWYRISITTTPVINTDVLEFDFFSGGFSPTDIGYTYYWGAQMEVGPLTDYVKNEAAADITAHGYVVITNKDGNFIDGEPLSFSGADPSFSHGFSSGFS
jgi:hypothetical protein